MLDLDQEEIDMARSDMVHVAALARRRNGVVTARELDELGFTRSSVSRLARDGVLHRLHRGVYAVGHAALSREGTWTAAVLGAGAGAALSHWAAAEAGKIVRSPAWRPEVVVPRAHRGLAGVRVHQSRSLCDDDLATWRGIPVTAVARTLVDLADVSTPEQLAFNMHQAEWERSLDLEAFEACMGRNRNRRGYARLHRAIELNLSGSAGSRSGFESRFPPILRAAGVVEPVLNTDVMTPGGPIEVDFHWPEQRLVVEIDGHGHARRRTRREDARRDALLRAAGFRILRISGNDVIERPQKVVRLVSVALAEPSCVVPATCNVCVTVGP